MKSIINSLTGGMLSVFAFAVRMAIGALFNAHYIAAAMLLAVMGYAVFEGGCTGAFSALALMHFGPR